MVYRDITHVTITLSQCFNLLLHMSQVPLTTIPLCNGTCEPNYAPSKPQAPTLVTYFITNIIKYINPTVIPGAGKKILTRKKGHKKRSGARNLFSILGTYVLHTLTYM